MTKIICNLLILRIMKKKVFETWLTQAIALIAAQKWQAAKAIQTEKTDDMPAAVLAGRCSRRRYAYTMATMGRYVMERVLA